MFDLDGTLVETAPEITDAVNDTLQQFGWATIDEAQVARWIGHGTGALLVQAVARATDTPAAAVRDSERLAAIGTVYEHWYAQRCGTRSRLYPQVRETLATLRGQGTRLAIVTNKEQRYTRRVLQAHQLADAFDEVICGDTLSTRKPDPAGVLACLRRFGAAPERSLFVGDSSIDAATARNAGVPVWLLPYGYNMGQPIEQAAPDRVIPDFSALTS
ncbi:MAG: phosphoglycolate phosphatase [Rubrivivax sp.]|nr:phosphoglycolate phosphatase [Rubrivivax sp.]